MSNILSYLDIIERMKGATDLKNDSAVARALKVTPQALSNYKKRDTMPSHLIINFASIYGLSVDWLLTGKGHHRNGGAGGPIATDVSLQSAMESSPHYEADSEKSLNIKQLTPEELIYIGKLLSVIRSENESAIKTLKFNIDAFFRSKDLFPAASSKK